MKKQLFLLLISFLVGFHAIGQGLEDYLKIAAENNPGVQAKFKEFEASLQKAAQIRSLPDPTLSFGYFISPVETRVGPQRARFSINQMFPWFGTLKYYGNGAEALAEANYQTFLNARNELFYRVKAAYYPMVELEQLIHLEEENIHILETYKSLATDKFANGSGSMVNVLRVDIRLKDAISNLDILKMKRKTLQTSFNNLLNRNEDEPIHLEESLTFDPNSGVYRYDSLLLGHPQLEAISMKIKAAESNERVAANQALPKIGVGLDYVLIGKREDMSVDDNGKNALMPMVSMSLPIFSGKYKAAEKEAQLMQEAYSYQYQELENQLLSNFEMKAYELEKQATLIQLYETQTLQSQQSLDLLFSSFSNSGNDFEEVLLMQQELLKYQKMKVEALVKLEVTKAELDYITAKSFEL
ncbi:TolC family protein [Algoriphagus sp. CAU 1675]|uniref:TolC family protein n=1 Tax=Algoriphagus sp. CAU 1675 TaxID=3032597 RepID=UPI0023DA6BFB|nr:TolC family protein [Algoriphagus sp. CAU 1675]MDF2157645.1 TolC family protein [Algoriphagus sp. CAU 1675]